MRRLFTGPQVRSHSAAAHVMKKYGHTVVKGLYAHAMAPHGSSGSAVATHLSISTTALVVNLMGEGEGGRRGVDEAKEGEGRVEGGRRRCGRVRE